MILIEWLRHFTLLREHKQQRWPISLRGHYAHTRMLNPSDQMPGMIQPIADTPTMIWSLGFPWLLPRRFGNGLLGQSRKKLDLQSPECVCDGGWLSHDLSETERGTIALLHYPVPVACVGMCQWIQRYASLSIPLTMDNFHGLLRLGKTHYLLVQKVSFALFLFLCANANPTVWWL